ncbi:chemotaxis protein [Aliarcobacter trophiarum LMG 25534]|uniref:Cache sensor-containing MCP-domain signal transduction protein n=1 Tax=Aliarcobacter trophiarum LMG 25534 TaxID=1032241 RepID=A0AAD0VNT5_9BACT|nr:methyl-accepting chemotaxis protein [Aliarcobacter trophiarum]AXK49771.1 Cache sensor-containing MCP-domain signal transduction protein [Aliarcobacter trophiarum LMG 25534]RXI28093.1 chemotaxis protein [Aliarcobacter trophiarum]RXJ92453.1 chemotaxis protein [Aliarcobacter trophiarum LMG 25534]
MNSVIKKFSFFQALAITIILVFAVISISIVVKNFITKDVKITFQDRVLDIKATFEVLNESIKESALSISNVFTTQLNNIEIDNVNKIDVNGTKTSILFSNGVPLNNNNALIDNFTKTTGAVATVFVKQEDGFFRIATSLHKEDGTRAIGTFLAKDSPAFSKILNKEDYLGSVELFGKKYMTVYKPIIQDGEVIGILFVAYNFDKLYSILEGKLERIKFGEKGYLYTIDSKAEILTIHPTLKNKKLNELDKNVEEALKEMINKKEGVLSYEFNDGKDIVHKLSAFTTFDEWNMVIVTNSDIESLLVLNDTLRQYSIFGGILLLLTLLAISYYTIKKTVNEPLLIINKDLDEFFAYLNREKENIDFVHVNTKDEFGRMSKILSDNIEKTRVGIEEDRKLINETISVLSEFEHGDLCQRINIEVSNPALIQLKNVLNKMANNLENNIENVLDILEKYSEYNYLSKIPTKDLKEHLLKLANGVNTLGDSITTMLIENKKNGLTLGDSSNVLLENVNKLNSSSNSAAASLEETAAAIEEITSTVRSNSENITKMALLSNDVTKSVVVGEKYANQTTTAMDEINTQVNLVNEAIGVIDNIAFQTNILSLNAAVEAATAGEAGKGFAVVAQEVRNLASRSAEAAKEIKDIVELATQKANEGKEIANSMIDGYKELNSNVSQTINLITDIQNSSKEQLLGIEQINDVVNNLDRQTQQNAQIASETNEIAKLTDSIAKVIVDDTNSKEFHGKDSVRSAEIEA